MAIACLALAIASLVLLFATARGTRDWRGRPVGTDFSEVYAAGQMVWDGAATKVWDWPSHFRVQQALHHSHTVDLYGWHYPPPFLLVAAAIAWLPYVVALSVWQVATLTPFTMMITRLTGVRDAWLFVLAAPVTLICLTHGQNGFLTALLLGGGLMWLERRPFAAGIFLGCLVYKPQFALVIPFVLLVTGNWRAIVGAVLSSLTLIAISLAIWGWPVWQAFFDSLPLTQHVIVEHGRTGWSKIMSPFSAVRSWGGTMEFGWLSGWQRHWRWSLRPQHWRQRTPPRRNQRHPRQRRFSRQRLRPRHCRCAFRLSAAPSRAASPAAQSGFRPKVRSCRAALASSGRC